MKKILFGLIATVLFTNLCLSQNYAMEKSDFLILKDEMEKNLTSKEVDFKTYDKQMDSNLLSNIDTYRKDGMVALFRKNNLNPKIYENFTSFHDGKFKDLYEATDGLSKDEIKNLIALENIYTSLLGDNSPSAARLTRNCAEAIAGILLVSVSAIAVTGGIGLVFWLLSHGYATYQLIRAC